MALNIGDLYASIFLDDKLSGGLEAAGKKMSAFGSSMMPMSVAIGGLGVAALKFSTDLNAAMANVATLIPGNTERVKQLKTEVAELAVTVGKGSGDIADGLYQVVSAFGDSADTAKILETNAKAAAAGLATTNDAIALTSAVTKGYGDVSAEAVKKAADLAFVTVKLGQTTFPELSASIGAVTPIAAALGVEQEELFAGFATLTGVTGNASEVSTQLKSVLSSMMKPTEDMAEAIAKLGFESSKAMVEELGMAEAARQLVGTTDGSTEAVGKLFASVRALPAVFALTGGQAAVFDEKLVAMTSAMGAADEAFREQTQGINAAGFAFAQLKERVSKALGDLGDVLMPVVISFTETAILPMISGMEDVIDVFSKMPSWVQTVAVAMGGLVAAAGPVLMGLGMMMPALTALLPLVGSLGVAVSVAAGAFLTFLGPITLVVGVGLAIWFASGAESMSDFLDALQLVGDAFLIFVGSIVGPVWSAITGLGGWIKEVAVEVIGIWIDRIKLVTFGLVDFGGIMTGVGGMFNQLSIIVNNAGMAWDALKATWHTAAAYAMDLAIAQLKLQQTYAILANDTALLARLNGEIAAIKEWQKAEVEAAAAAVYGTQATADSTTQAAAALTNMEAAAKKLQTTGVGVEDDDVDRMSRGGKAAEEYAKEVAALGQAFSGADLAKEIQLTSDALASFSGPVLASQLEGIADVVQRGLAANMEIPPNLMAAAATYNAQQFALQYEPALQQELDDMWASVDVSGGGVSMVAVVDAGQDFERAAAASADALNSVQPTLEQMDATGPSFMASIESAAGALGNIGGGLQALFDGLEGAGVDMGSAWGQALQGGANALSGAGSMLQGIASMDLGSIISGGFQMVGGLFQMFGGETEVHRVSREMGQILGTGISDELSQQLIDTAEDLGIDVADAMLLSLSAVADDTNQTFTDMATQIGDLMSGVAGGSIPLVQGVDAIGDAFSNLADEAAAGVAGADTAMLQMMQNARALGQDIPAISDAVQAALDPGFDALQSFFDVDEGGIALSATSSGQLFGAFFGAALGEYGPLEALEQLGPVWEQLGEQFGDQIGTMFPAEMAEFMSLSGEEFAPLLGQIGDSQTMLDSLADSAYMTTGAFTALGESAVSEFQALIDGGASQEAALMALRPLLGDLSAEATRYGVALDPATQALIDQAESMGAFPVDPMMQVVDLLSVLVQGMGFDLPAAVGSATSAMGGMGAAAADAAANAAGTTQAALEAINETTVTAVEDITLGAQMLNESLTSGVSSAIGMMGETAGTAVAGITDSFVGMGEVAIGVGYNVSEGWASEIDALPDIIAGIQDDVSTNMGQVAAGIIGPSLDAAHTVEDISNEIERLGPTAAGLSGFDINIHGSYHHATSGGSNHDATAQHGGIFASPTTVLLGERGPEAVYPLTGSHSFPMNARIDPADIRNLERSLTAAFRDAILQALAS